jgi:hypothetical protein
MRIEKVEHIYLTDEDSQVWGDFVYLLMEMRRDTQNPKVESLIDDIQDKIFDLSDYVEVE